MTLTVGSILGGRTQTKQERSLMSIAEKPEGRSRNNRPFREIPAPGSWLLPYAPLITSAISFSAIAPFLNNLPVRLGNIHGGCPRSRRQATVEHQIEAPVHRSEHLDPAGAGRAAGYIGAGRDQRLTQLLQNCIGDFGFRLPDGHTPGISGDLQRHPRRDAGAMIANGPGQKWRASR